ncbi:MAG TPA: hypothetical protein VFE53_18320, partial [Mucilaginibacter sp.]|nr:hypothetical protein [Mucilaginibacter sp.]
NVVNKRDTTAVNYFANYSKADVAISQIKGKVIKSYQMIVKAALKPDIEAAVKEQLGKKERDQLPAALGQDINGDKGNKGRIQALQRALNEAIEKGNASGIAQAVDDLASIAAYHIIDDALNPFTKSLGKKTPVATKYLTEATLTDLKKALDKDVAGDPYLKTTYNANGLIDVDTKIEQQFRDLIDFTARQPLVVAGYNYSKGAAGKLDVQSLGLDGSWGLNKLGSKKTNQLTASLADTLTSNPGEKTNTFDRDLGVIKAGLNTVLLMSKKESVMELNVGAEDDYIFTKPVTGESANKFMFDATWRVRLPGSPWLKLDLKYDPKSANVFGLFNFTYNLDNSSASGKSSNSTGSSGSGN